MNNKLFIFIVGIPFILFITIGGYFLWDINRSTQPQETISVGLENVPPLPSPENTVVTLPLNPPVWKDPASPLNPVSAPQSTPPEPLKIIIPTKKVGGVSVNNFYRDTQTQTFDMGKDAVIKDEPQYKILYYTIDHSFFIFLLGGNLSIVRTTAEQELLKKLNTTESQACDLLVSVLVDKDVGVSAPGMDYKLSFCPNGKPLP